MHEVKYDGFRLLCRVERGKARLVTRNGTDWTSLLQPVAAAVAALGMREAWLDGELVYLDDDGIPDFEVLHRTLRKRHGAARLHYQVFDLPYLHGADLTGRPLLERKLRLEEWVRDRCDAGRVRYCDYVDGDGASFFRAAHAAGVEGIVCKRARSLYHPGARTGDWLKVKCFHRYRVRVLGFTPRVAELLVCFEGAGGEPVYAGRVSGWCRGPLRGELVEAVRALRTDACPWPGKQPPREAIQWVRPGLRVEVAALPWRAGRKLRHATLKGVTLAGAALCSAVR
ncbi:MAG TPA: hypothetical protein VFX98_19895 [Longimicrobiaceae bacterium]|nr:hypothetical protein [Longimicrobiaceae bacterium]